MGSFITLLLGAAIGAGATWFYKDRNQKAVSAPPAPMPAAPAASSPTSPQSEEATQP